MKLCAERRKGNGQRGVLLQSRENVSSIVLVSAVLTEEDGERAAEWPSA